MKIAKNVYNMLDKMVVEMGVGNCIQIVIDNVVTYVVITSLFWSPYAAHCLALLLKDIWELI